MSAYPYLVQAVIVLGEEIRLIVSGTPNHNFIAGNLLVTLTLSLKTKTYQTFALNQRLWLRDDPEVILTLSSVGLQVKIADLYQSIELV